MTQKSKAKARVRAAKISRRLTFRELKDKGIRESRMTVWRRIQNNEFPKPIVDHGRTYWLEDEIDKHVAELAKLPRGGGQRPSPKKEA
jgi:predicted DNA-binding transcriptional regulator AlpA